MRNSKNIRSWILIGAEFSIFLIDYKKFQKIKEFKNDASYALFKLSEQYLLTSYGKGFLQIYKMSRDSKGQLELKLLLLLTGEQLVKK